MNFSLNGINNNDESLLIIKDKNLSMQYYDYFKTKWNEWNKEYN
jgi:phosphatidylserine/phosphatidylglycerophosphate/cardiolipin synthase-like enzyme